jgi:hypothetical protein
MYEPDMINDILKTLACGLDGPVDDSTCWFCKSSPSEEEHKREIPMYNNVHLGSVEAVATGYMVEKKWSTSKVPIPRCSNCHSAHSTRNTWRGWCGLLAGLGWLILVACNSTVVEGWFGVVIVGGIGAFIIGWIGAGVGHLLGAMFADGSIPPEKFGKEYPAVKMMVAEGWKFGTQPQPGEEYKS